MTVRVKIAMNDKFEIHVPERSLLLNFNAIQILTSLCFAISSCGKILRPSNIMSHNPFDHGHASRKSHSLETYFAERTWRDVSDVCADYAQSQDLSLSDQNLIRLFNKIWL